MLTRTFRSLRTVRAGYACQPYVWCKYLRRRAACPRGGALLYVPPQRAVPFTGGTFTGGTTDYCTYHPSVPPVNVPPVNHRLLYVPCRTVYRGTTGDGTRVAVPSFFGKREEEKPGAARGQEGLNEQGYDPYDAKAVDSSTLDTKPVFIALAVATAAIGALSVSNSIF